MVGKRRWIVLVLTRYCLLAQSTLATLCEHESCRCDEFPRLACECRRFSDEIIIKAQEDYNLPSMTTEIVIVNCSTVHLLTNAVKKLQNLRKIELFNIKQLYMNSHSITSSSYADENDMQIGLKILIRNCTVNEISSNAIQGKIQSIIISDSRIKNIKPFAFSSLTDVHNIEMKNNIYENINIQAFKKFSTNNFIISGGNLGVLPSRFLSSVEVLGLFLIEDATIEYANSLSFLVNAPKKIIIKNNTFGTLAADAFHISTRGPIIFKYNRFHTVKSNALLGLTVDPSTMEYNGKQELLLYNNTVTELQESSLFYDNSTLMLQVDNLFVEVPCKCDLVHVWKWIIKDFGGSILCRYTAAHYVSLNSFVSNSCYSFNKYLWFFVVVTLLIFILIATIVIIFIFKRLKSQKKKSLIIIPDGKTYRETEFHIVFERAELLMTDL